MYERGMYGPGAEFQFRSREDVVLPRPLVNDQRGPRDGGAPVVASPRGFVYLIGSLRNPIIPSLGRKIRALGYEVFDDWHGAGPEADDQWQRYEQDRGRTYTEALRGRAAQHVFAFDKKHLDMADIGVLVLPAGKSGHLELGYLAGRGKRTFILFDKEPERWDVMYNFATGVFLEQEQLMMALGL